MDIQWLGHSCFSLRGATVTVITDPYGPSLGFPPPSLQGGIVTISHDHPHHGYDKGVEGVPYVARTPGEYDIEGVSIRGIASPLLQEAGDGGRNVIYVIEMDGITLVHLGDLGQTLLPRQVEELSRANVLFVPAGGNCTITPLQAAEMVNLLEPRLVVPMHYGVADLPIDLGGVDDFFKELGAADMTPQTRLSVTPTNLPGERRVVLLERISS